MTDKLTPESIANTVFEIKTGWANIKTAQLIKAYGDQRAAEAVRVLNQVDRFMDDQGNHFATWAEAVAANSAHADSIVGNGQNEIILGVAGVGGGKLPNPAEGYGGGQIYVGRGGSSSGRGGVGGTAQSEHPQQDNAAVRCQKCDLLRQPRRAGDLCPWFRCPDCSAEIVDPIPRGTGGQTGADASRVSPESPTKRSEIKPAFSPRDFDCSPSAADIERAAQAAADNDDADPGPWHSLTGQTQTNYRDMVRAAITAYTSPPPTPTKLEEVADHVIPETVVEKLERIRATHSHSNFVREVASEALAELARLHSTEAGRQAAETKLDGVARAMAVVDEFGTGDWDNLADEYQSNLRTLTRAAARALRNPTMEHCARITEAFGRSTSWPHSAPSPKTMITVINTYLSAILEEGK